MRSSGRLTSTPLAAQVGGQVLFTLLMGGARTAAGFRGALWVLLLSLLASLGVALQYARVCRPTGRGGRAGGAAPGEDQLADIGVGSPVAVRQSSSAKLLDPKGRHWERTWSRTWF